MINRSIDFSFVVHQKPVGELRVTGYVTGASAFRLQQIRVSYSLLFGFKYRNGLYLAEPKSVFGYDDVPAWLIEYVNSAEFCMDAMKELLRIARRFDKAAEQQRVQAARIAKAKQPDDGAGSEDGT